MRTLLAMMISLFCLNTLCRAQAAPWPAEKARQWGQTKGWLVGCNFSPSTAINQLEMFQPDSFDEATIERELGWAQDLGFNSIRVFLHNLLWDQDSAGFLQRLDRFLAIADKHKIGVMFVLLDSCWDPTPALGKQRAPKPFVHNSGWVQAPGMPILMDPAKHDSLAPYIKGVVARFKDDARVQVWDIFNEPDNGNDSSYSDRDKKQMALGLIQKAYGWAREVGPSQPITSGVWIGNWPDADKLSPMEKWQLEQSDIITFHNYAKMDELAKCIANLRRYNRPIICTEYMARPVGSTFDPNLGYFKQQGVGAYNWGFVSGKTQTIFPWDSWKKTYTAEPPLWFHDIFRPDGKAYDQKEVDYIKRTTGVAK